MNKLKSHFWYNKRQRNGIFFLLVFIVLLQGFYFFGLPLISLNDRVEISEGDQLRITKFQKQLDSLELLSNENSKPTIHPFNPSFITDFKGYQLGMSIDEINRLLKFRNEGNYINSVDQFQNVTKVSDSLLAAISPYFKFPDWVLEERQIQPANNRRVTKKRDVSIDKQDLNIVTKEELLKIYGVGEILSTRIIKFRTSLGGFLNDDQLREVYGLKPEVVDEILKRYTVLSKPEIEKLNVNTATFKEVLRLPYIDYELTKLIFNYRDEVAEIQSLEELKNIEGFPVDKFDRIAVYLVAK